MDETKKSVSLGDFLTDAEIRKAFDLWKQRKDQDKKFDLSYAQAVHDEIIFPNMDRIDAKLGQKNDAKFLAYAVEYAMMRSEDV